MKIIRSTITLIAFWAACAVVGPGFVSAQSRDQNFPTAVKTNEIVGTLKARDIGDSRLTSYYYVFDGGQGDIFINVVTTNFNGDIDVFTKEALRPLTKMVIYADTSANETGRLIYLRKSERLILRVQGRTPNDDPATFRIKFGGSFVAITDQKEEAPPTLEAADTESKTKVNSVGTIVEALPKSTPKNDPSKSAAKDKVAVDESKPKTVAKSETKKPETKPTVVVEDKTMVKAEEVPASKPTKTANPPTKAATKSTNPPTPVEKKVDPLASIRLVIQLKDGSVIERPMSEVSKFIVDKGILTVTAKDGRLSRFSILDVAKVTIE